MSTAPGEWKEWFGVHVFKLGRRDVAEMELVGKSWRLTMSPHIRDAKLEAKKLVDAKAEAVRVICSMLGRLTDVVGLEWRLWRTFDGGGDRFIAEVFDEDVADISNVTGDWYLNASPYIDEKLLSSRTSEGAKFEAAKLLRDEWTKTLRSLLQRKKGAR